MPEEEAALQTVATSQSVGSDQGFASLVARQNAGHTNAST